MKILVNFRQTEGNDQEMFVIDTEKQANNLLQQHLLDCIKLALKDSDKTAEFTLYVDHDFTDGWASKSKKSDASVTIWY